MNATRPHIGQSSSWRGRRAFQNESMAGRGTRRQLKKMARKLAANSFTTQDQARTVGLPSIFPPPLFLFNCPIRRLASRLISAEPCRCPCACEKDQSLQRHEHGPAADSHPVHHRSILQTGLTRPRWKRSRKVRRDVITKSNII